MNSISVELVEKLIENMFPQYSHLPILSCFKNGARQQNFSFRRENDSEAP